MKSPLKLFVFTLAVLLSSCYSHKSAVASGAHNAQLIQWPEGYAPETADFYVYNEIDIAASPEIVWDILIQAESWGQWYPHAKNLTIEQQHKDRLDSGVSFQWNPAKKLQFVSTVQVFNPPYQLAWSARESRVSKRSSNQTGENICSKNGFTCLSKLVVGSKRTGRSAVELQFQGISRL